MRVEAERVFVRKMAALRRRLETDDPYDAIDAATIMYHILCDGLLTQANQQARRAITFSVVSSSIDEAPVKGQVLHQAEHELVPSANANPDQIQALRPGQFLNYGILIYSSQRYTVEDVLTVCANALGGKHYGPPRSQRARLAPLYELGEGSAASITFPNGEQAHMPPATLSAARRIGRAVVAAMEPLELQLRARAL